MLSSIDGALPCMAHHTNEKGGQIVERRSVSEGLYIIIMIFG